MTTPATAYRETRERVTALLQERDESQAGIRVLSTPGWTIKDVAAHLSGLVADWMNGNTDNYGADEWTERQVDERRDRSLAEVLEEWNASAPKFEAMLNDPDANDVPAHIPFITVADVAIHEHDIRGALGKPGARDSSAVLVGMKTYVTGVRQRHEASGHEPMVIRETDGREWSIGTGEPIVTVSAPRYELFRAMADKSDALTPDLRDFVIVLVASTGGPTSSTTATSTSRRSGNYGLQSFVRGPPSATPQSRCVPRGPASRHENTYRSLTSSTAS